MLAQSVSNGEILVILTVISKLFSLYLCFLIGQMQIITVPSLEGCSINKSMFVVCLEGIMAYSNADRVSICIITGP